MTTDTYAVDERGFPVEQCRRCAGRGELPQFNHRWAGVCLACNGAGTVYPTPTIAKLASWWTAETDDFGRSVLVGQARAAMESTLRRRAARHRRAEPVTVEPVVIGEIPAWMC